MRLRSWCPVLAGVLILCGCSNSQNRSPAAVFEEPGGFQLTSHLHTHDTLDVGIPVLQSKAQDPLKVTGARLTAVPGGGSEQPTIAFSNQRVGHGVYDELGDLPKRCPKVYVPLRQPYPSVEPGKPASFFLVMPIRIPRAGDYRLPPLVVSYRDLVTGKSGVQTMRLPYTFDVKFGPAETFPPSGCYAHK